MTSRGIGLGLGLMLMATSALAQTPPAAPVAPKPATAAKPATPAAKLATAVAKPAAAAVPAMPKPATAPSTAKPATVASSASSMSSSAASAPKPRPAAKPLPAVAATVPVECLSFDISPFGALQGVDVTGPTHAPVHFDVEVASQPAQRGQGLMCRQKLAMTQGMLFEFPKPDEQIFWMHDTLIPLDIIYVAPDGHIVSITHARPLNDRKLPSHGAANGVLEINGGLADKLGLKPGDVVTHPFFVPAPIVATPAPVAASSMSASSISSQ